MPLIGFVKCNAGALMYFRSGGTEGEERPHLPGFMPVGGLFCS
jgi:hypothetical protein